MDFYTFQTSGESFYYILYTMIYYNYCKNREYRDKGEGIYMWIL